ncbi:MAG: HigA family addiction module antitoxin [Burkholderiaceae bacterium]|nr:HigA family addiction module antitoxin [Burkholderiaceae bacterium]
MLSRVLHGHAPVNADMDLRLSEALGATPGYWLAMQTQRDLWTAKEHGNERSAALLQDVTIDGRRPPPHPEPPGIAAP